MIYEHHPRVGGVPKAFTQYNTFLADEPMPLLDFVMKKLDGIKRSKAKAILANGGVLVNDEVQTHVNFPVEPEMVVAISRQRISEPPLRTNNRLAGKGFDIVYEDNDIIVVDKDDEVLSMGAGKDSLNMKSLLDEYFVRTRQRCRAHVVHRLDARTSGLLVYAKNIEAQQKLYRNWREMVIDRRYVALVEGVMVQNKGHIESWLKDTPSMKIYSSPFDNGGQWASTDWELVASNGLYSLITVKLHTGRKNQIRVHMKVIGHPVAGDFKYGAKTDPVERLCLHAFRLAFYHPVTGEPLSFETPFPQPFIDAVK